MIIVSAPTQSVPLIEHQFKDKNVSENTLKDISIDTFKLPDYRNQAIVPKSDDVMDILKKSYDQ